MIKLNKIKLGEHLKSFSTKSADANREKKDKERKGEEKGRIERRGKMIRNRCH